MTLGVDAVLRMFDPDAKPEATCTKQPRKPSSSPTVPNLSRTVLGSGGVAADAAMLKATTRKMGKQLDHHRRRGVVVGSDVGGRMLGWSVSPNT